RATLQTWSLVLYGTKEFTANTNAETTAKPFKNKTTFSKKKNTKKFKNKYTGKTIPTTKSSKVAFKNKIKVTIPKAIPTTPSNKYKKVSRPTTELSPYFYAINNSKYKNSDDGVKQYLKFVKNITITYPILIPARDVMKPPEIMKKTQKQKEKSRDINSNRDLKGFSSKPQVTTPLITTTTPKIKTT
ncbi:hypothetical protein HHI36_023055, partial [Cryptolaemus montrouzieri]